MTEDQEVLGGCGCQDPWSAVLGATVGASRTPFRPTRRNLLIAAGLLIARPFRAGAAEGGGQRDLTPHLAAYGLAVNPRSAWAGTAVAPARNLAVEDDVRVLIVHHAETPNGYAAEKVPALIRGIHSFHTGPEKGWPDVAYGFFIDRFGIVWEARTASLTSATAGSATGGNQGFSRLVCLLGDYRSVVPTAATLDSLAKLLAALADLHRIDTKPTAVATFVSRGSNRWKKGEKVEVPTISGHRQLSRTACPGDAAFAIVQGSLPSSVEQLRSSRRK